MLMSQRSHVSAASFFFPQSPSMDSTADDVLLVCNDVEDCYHNCNHEQAVINSCSKKTLQGTSAQPNHDMSDMTSHWRNQDRKRKASCLENGYLDAKKVLRNSFSELSSPSSVSSITPLSPLKLSLMTSSPLSQSCSTYAPSSSDSTRMDAAGSPTMTLPISPPVLHSMENDGTLITNPLKKPRTGSVGTRTTVTGTTKQEIRFWSELNESTTVSLDKEREDKVESPPLLILEPPVITIEVDEDRKQSLNEGKTSVETHQKLDIIERTKSFQQTVPYVLQHDKGAKRIPYRSPECSLKAEPMVSELHDVSGLNNKDVKDSDAIESIQDTSKPPCLRAQTRAKEALEKAYDSNINYLFECWLVTLSNDVLTQQLLALKADNRYFRSQLNLLREENEKESSSEADHEPIVDNQAVTNSPKYGDSNSLTPKQPQAPIEKSIPLCSSISDGDQSLSPENASGSENSNEVVVETVNISSMISSCQIGEQESTSCSFNDGKNESERSNNYQTSVAVPAGCSTATDLISSSTIPQGTGGVSTGIPVDIDTIDVVESPNPTGPQSISTLSSWELSKDQANLTFKNTTSFPLAYGVPQVDASCVSTPATLTVMPSTSSSDNLWGNKSCNIEQFAKRPAAKKSALCRFAPLQGAPRTDFLETRVHNLQPYRSWFPASNDSHYSQHLDGNNWDGTACAIDTRFGTGNDSNNQHNWRNPGIFNAYGGSLADAPNSSILGATPSWNCNGPALHLKPSLFQNLNLRDSQDKGNLHPRCADSQNQDRKNNGIQIVESFDLPTESLFKDAIGSCLTNSNNPLNHFGRSFYSYGAPMDLYCSSSAPQPRSGPSRFRKSRASLWRSPSTTVYPPQPSPILSPVSCNNYSGVSACTAWTPKDRSALPAYAELPIAVAPTAIQTNRLPKRTSTSLITASTDQSSNRSNPPTSNATSSYCDRPALEEPQGTAILVTKPVQSELRHSYYDEMVNKATSFYNSASSNRKSMLEPQTTYQPEEQQLTRNIPFATVDTVPSDTFSSTTIDLNQFAAPVLPTTSVLWENIGQEHSREVKEKKNYSTDSNATSETNGFGQLSPSSSELNGHMFDSFFSLYDGVTSGTNNQMFPGLEISNDQITDDNFSDLLFVHQQAASNVTSVQQNSSSGNVNWSGKGHHRYRHTRRQHSSLANDGDYNKKPSNKIQCKRDEGRYSYHVSSSRHGSKQNDGSESQRWRTNTSVDDFQSIPEMKRESALNSETSTIPCYDQQGLDQSTSDYWKSTTQDCVSFPNSLYQFTYSDQYNGTSTFNMV